MKLEDIKEVRETKESTMVNHLLTKGFFLIKVVKVRELDQEGILYILGKGLL